MTQPVQDSLMFGNGETPPENFLSSVGSSFDRDPGADSSCAKLEPNLAEAEEFLRVLDPDGEFSFQTFDDNEERGKLNKEQKGFDPYAKIYHGKLDKCRRSLAALNQNGAGIFVTVNRTDLKGRKSANVVCVRALFLDLDGAPLEPVVETSRVSEIPPHIVVESSPGRFHVYWRVSDVALDEFESYQKALIRKFDGDPAVHDLPRVMRLPGFWHQKNPDKPFMTRILEVPHE